MTSFFLWQSIISLTRFLLGFKLQPPYPLSSGSITRLEACRGESYLVPCSFVCISFCVFFAPSVWAFADPLFVGFYCKCLEWLLCLCFYISVCSLQPLWACVSLVLFRSIKQFRHLHGLLLRAEDPTKCLTVAQEPRALLTNICSRCELLACNIYSAKRENALAHMHVCMQTCGEQMPCWD